jgi:hypothetical protein
MKDYTIGTFKIEIAFWIWSVWLFSKFSSLAFNEYFVIAWTLLGTSRLCFAFSAYFDIKVKNNNRYQNE